MSLIRKVGKPTPNYLFRFLSRFCNSSQGCFALFRRQGEWREIRECLRSFNSCKLSKELCLLTPNSLMEAFCAFFYAVRDLCLSLLCSMKHFFFHLCFIIRYWMNLTPSDIMWNTSDTGWVKAAWSSVFAPWICGSCVFVHNMPQFKPAVIAEVRVYCEFDFRFA